MQRKQEQLSDTGRLSKGVWSVNYILPVKVLEGFTDIKDLFHICIGSAICSLPPWIGPITCLASFPRYFYNSTSGMCEFFIYGGCRGTQNNFETLAECKMTCGELTTNQ